MPLGPFGEVVGTTGTLETLGEEAQNYKTKVVAPRNPKIVRTDDDQHKEDEQAIQKVRKNKPCPLLIRDTKPEPLMTPSRFLFDMKLNTEQKLANTHVMRIPRKIELLDMGETSLQKFSDINIDDPLFQPFPSEIFFQNFEPFETYEIPLVLRNNDKVPRLVKVTQANSPYFKIISPHNVGHKVGPGLPITFIIQFMPDQKQDYEHELICHTEREKFVVPVHAIGARAILDFPDDVHFPVCPVKYPNNRTLLVRNIGNRDAKFALEAEKPFSVIPEIGTLAVNDNMQVTIEFNPNQTGDFRQDLIISYDTGEKVYVSLYGAAQDANVRLEKNALRIENTYVSMASQRTVVIANRSDVIAHFRWTQFATQEEEEQQKLLHQIELEREENTDTDRFLEECVTDPTLRDKLSILSRTFQNRKRLVERDPLLFDDDVIKIEPVEGDIWPNSTFEVNVIFKPQEAIQYTRTAFCDITGRQSRLPLRIRGEGSGPKLEFSFEVLDMGNIFIGSKHNYEVILANKGDIDAIYSVLPNNSTFGPCFAFTPAEGIVMPGGHQAVQVTFSSPFLGDFLEDFFFQIDGTCEKLKLTFKGSVTGPTFQFNVPKLKFGTVSYGFKNTMTCTLMNTSLVYMSFRLRVPGDGPTPSICATTDMDPDVSQCTPTPRHGIHNTMAKEFEILPSIGTIPPQSEMEVAVTLTSNHPHKYENALVVDVDQVGEEILSLPITAKCIVPEITVLSPVLDFGRCFLRYPYESILRLHNDTDLPAKYIFLPEKELEIKNPPILYESPKPKGLIMPHSVCEVPLIIRAQKLEEQEVPCYVAIFGSPDPPLCVRIVCIGEGPVVHTVPQKLDWGSIPVLTDLSQSILLSNESLIPAIFTAHMMRPNSTFRVNPGNGEIPPESTIEISVTANLDDCVRFQDKLQLNFFESQSRLVPLFAHGYGTTIVSDPPLLPVMDLGPNFSNRTLKKTFRLTNRGRRHQQLMWSTEGFNNVAIRKHKSSINNTKDIKVKDRPAQPDVPQPVFSLTPSRMDLKSGDSVDFHLEGFVSQPQFVNERLLCHAILGRQGGKELIIKVDLSTEFISPLLEFSTKSVFFRVDKMVKDVLEIQTRSLKLSNVSPLPLTVSLALPYPFNILLASGEKVQEMDICLAFQENHVLTIQFDPAYKDDFHIRTIDEVLHVTYKEHPHVDYVALRGEVYFPNLEFEKTTLDFGCILNDTEVTRYVNIKNNSPMQVKYRWSFLVGNVPTQVKRIVRPRLPQLLEEVVQDVEEEQEEEKLESKHTLIVTDEETEKDEVKEEIPVSDSSQELDTAKKVEEKGSHLFFQEVSLAEDSTLHNKMDADKEEEEDNVDNRHIENHTLSCDSEVLEKGQLEEIKTEKEKEQKTAIMDRLNFGPRLSLHEDEEEALKSNRILTALLEQESEETASLGIEEVFDILPLYGLLEPGDTEQVTFTFFGHADIWGEVKAICEVEGGPTYELTITGEASLMEYHFDHKDIDFGKQMYDSIAVAELTLINTGKVAFEYHALNMDPALQQRPQPGKPILVPHTGKIEPFAEQKLYVHFLPGVPERFHKSFNIQVAHFEPAVINLYGEGVFPRISLDLPRHLDGGSYDALLAEARENISKGSAPVSNTFFQEHATASLLPVQNSSRNLTVQLQQSEITPSELEIQMEMERLAVRKFALQQQMIHLGVSVSSTTSTLTVDQNSQRDANSSHLLPVPPPESALDGDPNLQRIRRRKLKPRLPEYLLDFGYVILGTQRTHVVRATNTGWCPVSFKIDRGSIHTLGFNVELDRVRNLPGAPDNETVDFVVTFDPRAANLQLGPVETVVPINIVSGPQVIMRLKAHVTMPDMEISDDVLEFQEVKCGECRVITVQLHNHQQVRCDWSAGSTQREIKQALDGNATKAQRHLPQHLRKKMRNDKKQPVNFELLPPSGSLLPGQRINVQVKFMPTEEKFYEQRIPIKIAQSSQRILLLCRGQGLEPRLELEPQLVEFGPILPHSCGDERELIVRNPCNFPIEFYNLEFDHQYLSEERVLRVMRGYDENNTILLPTRNTGEKLPIELIDFYEEQVRKLDEEEQLKLRNKQEEIQKFSEEKEQEDQGASNDKQSDAAENLKVDISASTQKDNQPLTDALVENTEKKEEILEEKVNDTAVAVDRVGELEITPVSAAIARHLGIDLTTEGKAARNRRGLAIIVHGAPLSGKTTTAVMLARKFEAAILTVDGVVLDAIANGNSNAGLRARNLCAEAAHRRFEELRLLEGEEAEKRGGGLSVEAVTAHTQGAAVAVTGSLITNRKTSTVTETKAKDKHHGSIMGGKTLNTSSMEGSSQVPSSPPPLAAPIARRLSISASVAGEEGLMSCVLPEELLVEILSERLQLNDCHHGVVFDGLETLFSQNLFTTVNAILKSLNNRRFIYFCTLKLDFSVFKDQERKEQEEKERQAKIAEEQDRLRLEEMDEEEYDVLSEEEKARVDEKRLVIKKERIKREQEERAERERREREAREEEERRKEEEARLRKKNKGKQPDPKEKEKDKKGAPQDKKGQVPPSDRGPKSQGGARHDSERPESHQTEKSDGVEDAKKKKAAKDGKKLDSKGNSKEMESVSLEDIIKDPLKEAEILLMQRFRTFEHAQKDISELLELWDRTSLQIHRPPSPSDRSEEDGKDHPPSGKKGKGKGDKHDKEKEKEKEKEREKQRQLEREMAVKAAREAAAAEELGDSSEDIIENGDKGKEEESYGVPHIIVDCSDRSVPVWQKIFDTNRLPSVEDVLDGLGMGPHGPPIPPPATFAVVPYPVKRYAPPTSELGNHYIFVASSPEDPNAIVDEKVKESEQEEEKSVTPDKVLKEDHTPTKGKGKATDRMRAPDINLQRKKSAERKSRQARRSSNATVTPPPGPVTPVSDADNQSTTGENLALNEAKTPKLGIFRWIIQANGETTLRLRFQSEELGQFDQTLNFEIVGTRRRYQLFCRGICAFPTISKEPRIVFPSRKKTKKPNEIVQKKYILMNEMFEFGPLLVGKSRERYKEGKYPENMEVLNIVNTSPLETDISFCFLNDSKGDTFLMEPPSIILKPGESNQLSIWAYPKGPGRYEDAVVCCIRENPEPVVFKVACDGFRPDLDLDKKVFHFDRILLHRKDTKTIYLRNTTQLPVAWRLSGLETLGDDFTVASDYGVVEPLSEYALSAFFRAMKPVQTSKRMIRLEISDVDNIMGVVQTEPIQVIAEAYDVALDMSFPKGTDGGLDFGTIRVNEERKETCTLKNKGKYEITFNFVLENEDPSNPDITSMFSVIPSRATLGPMDRPTQVQVIFKSSREVVVREQTVLKCQVIEPNLGVGGEIIASIPVKLSVKSVYSRFNILPANDINFGSLLVNSKKTRTFTIENEGEHDFKFIITKLVKEASQQNVRQQRSTNKLDKRDGSSSAKSAAKQKKTDSIRQDAASSQSRLVIGMFTIFPSFGIIQPRNSQIITVECVAEAQGRADEDISIDISERDTKAFPGGIPYKLIAEACIPAVDIEDIGSIFEEHRICKNLNLWHPGSDTQIGGVYGEEEKRFVFNSVIVGRKAKSRFKISNISKVPCDVSFQLKPLSAKGAAKVQDIFDVEPQRTQIANHSHMYVTIIFSPPTMQSYGAIFEAVIEGVAQNQARGKSLVFEVAGEGNLPRVTVARPTVRTKRGQPLLLFKRILVGTQQSLPLELINDGTLISKVDIDLVDPDGSFSLQTAGSTQDATDIDFLVDPNKRPHTASVIVNVGETAAFVVIYRPTLAQRSQAHVRLSVVDNQYEDSIIQLVGEGYIDDITISNITSTPNVYVDPENQEGNMAEDNVAAAKPNLMQFGDCYINEARTLSLSMNNHSKTDCIRFSWPDHAQLHFSPQIGHLYAGCSKDVSVTFRSGAAITLAEEVVSARVVKITFDKPADQITDWDDRIKTVKWVDVGTIPIYQVSESALKTQHAGTAPQTNRPMKKKVVETEPEPTYTEVVESARDVSLLVSAVADYCKYSCNCDSIHFRDTLMFQTRIYEFKLHNDGTIAMEYTWQVVMDNFMPVIQRSVTFLSEGERPESRIDAVESSYVPFSIEPQFGSIPAGKNASFIVKFSPLDISEYEGRLICSIPNLPNMEQGPVIGLKACSLMPFCHFELQDSDYISSARRNPELRGPKGSPPGATLDPNTRVIEFNVVGVGVHNIKEFSILNPTNEKYKFEWICQDETNSKSPSCFKCLNTQGEIKSGRKFKIRFEFVSSKLDLVESFWRFVIPDQNISVPFLLVGCTREPDIALDRSHLNFKALLIGREAVETVYLINNEDTPFRFHFVEDSCHSEGYSSHLLVEPMEGEIPPKSRLAINLYFAPRAEKEVNFNLVCKIVRRVMPVTLNVKAEGYTMNCVLLCEDSQGNRKQLTSHGVNQINFGDVEVNEESIRQLFILNSGKFNFDYSWHLNEAASRRNIICIDPKACGVMSGETQKCTLSFCPPNRMTLRGCELELKISNGPTYNITITGQGVTPGLHFSFHSHNFGSVFIHREGMPTHTVTLTLTNKEKKELGVDCLYEATPFLHHNFEARVLASGESVDVPFTFYPREARKYQEQVTFQINGLSKQSVEFTGTGCEMKVEVADRKNKVVNLGPRYVGDVVKEYVPIVNNSPSPITFHIAFTPSSPKLQSSNVLSISPSGLVCLDPRGGSLKVEVVFKPKTRIPAFTEEVLLECAGMSLPLFVLRGSCLGMEVKMDTYAIPFGTVYHHSQTTRRLVMSNTGDMNTRFRWDINRFLPDFSISPVEGYITTGMEVTFDVNFHPQTISQDLRYDKLNCFLDGGPHKPIHLTLTGSCTGIPPVKEVQNFSTQVRGKDTKHISIPNRTNQQWDLTPIIEGDYWSGPVRFSVEPQQTKQYELVYQPLAMTSENKKHTGTVFFPLPDGTGLLFNLVGTAEPPKPSGKISRDVPCKTMYIEPLTVHNWLKKPQRFRAKIEPIKPDKLDLGTTLKGIEYIDVPPNSKKDYKLSFYAYREVTLLVKVMFTNEQSGEYQFYELTLRSTKSGVISSIDLSTPVRQSVPHTIRMDNPLPNPVTFSASCNVPEILMPSQLVVPALSQGRFNFEYQPLRIGESQGKLELNSSDLGQFTYDLILHATQASPEKAIYFRIGLGQNQVQVAKFLNFAKQKTDYTCRVDGSDFHVDKTITAAPGSTGGTEVVLEVGFEPSRLGEQRAMLVVTSPVGGEYTFPLFGTCTLPKPQGPFIVRAGSTTPIIFRNVFPNTTTFTFQVDNPLFHLTKQSESIRSKKEHRIVVGFDGSDSGSKAAVMGRLVVSCARTAGGSGSVQWVYYIKGTNP